ncbi:MAG: ABC transporter ATP-binding protein [Acidimicrobiales bacterium]
MTRLVEGIGLVRSYVTGAGELAVLRGADITIDAAETVVLSGRSGSGKTTLLNVLGGIDRADTGELTVCGTDIMQANESERAELRRTSLSFVFQAFGLLPVLSAAENVEVPLRLLGTSADERAERVAAMLRSVGLEKRARHRPGELSGGEQQRVAIARALVAQPRLLIADEPTGQLDTTTGRQIMRLLDQLAHEHGLAMLIATHDPASAGTGARHLVLRDGVLEPAAG